jgi:arsenical pump membrane protein
VQMIPAWLTACATTALVLAFAFQLEERRHRKVDPPPLRLGLGAAATLTAAVLVVTVPNAALPVLALGLLVTAARRLRPQLDLRALAFLFGLTLVLGTIARLWNGPAHLLDGRGPFLTAGIGAVAAVAVNNLPAAVVLSAQPTAHPDALLLGLDVGPNLAVTGSLSAVLWLRAARSVNARASIATYSCLGLLLVPVTLGLSSCVQCL